jgi:DNA mismatch repair protein MutL
MSEVIRLLPDHIANQIAAGEVIQRPASVVKELVENAIDSGAKSIDVLIKDAGKTLIQVLDNGCGMTEIDARMAFERHATSKLRSADDLFALTTKGFRGEALASIAAIAHVQLQTRQPDKELGTSLIIEGSEVKEQAETTCKVGSSFQVKNLFYNVPARRNFLKSDSVEFKHIEDEFLRIVLAHPNLKFSLIHNDQVVYHLEEANLRKRIVDLFGRTYNDKIIPINEETDIVKIEGFIGKPEFAKKSRGEQYFFVNNRFFRDSYFNHSLSQAYDNLLASKTFPSYFVFFTIKPQEIDVNVHPTKTEIKFENDKEIYAILKSSVKQSLGKFNIVPSIDFEQEKSFDLPWEMNNRPVVQPTIQVNPNYNPFHSHTSSKSIPSGNSAAISQAGFGFSNSSKADWDNFYSIDNIEEEIKLENEKIDFDENLEGSKDFIFHGNYLISSLKSGLLVVHSKRAKERILYDEIMNLFMIQPIHSQQVMFPIEFETKNSIIGLWEQNKKTIERLGFTWEVQENTLNFNGIPSYLELEQSISCIQSISDKLELSQIDKGELAHEFVLSISKSAANQQLLWNKESANQLINTLFSCPEHSYSPTGKLILKIIKNDELFQQF